MFEYLGTRHRNFSSLGSKFQDPGPCLSLAYELVMVNSVSISHAMAIKMRRLAAKFSQLTPFFNSQLVCDLLAVINST